MKKQAGRLLGGTINRRCWICLAGALLALFLNRAVWAGNALLSEGKFREAVVGINERYEKEATPLQAERDPYLTARLIVLTDGEADLSIYDPVQSAGDRNGTWVLQFDSPSKARSAAFAMKKDPSVLSVEPDRMICACGESSKDSAGESWGIAEMEADAYAKGLAGKGCAGSVCVAVLDGGISCSHPLLRDRILTERAHSFCSGLSWDESLVSEENRFAHGTQVAGILARMTRELSGNVKLIPVRILNERGFGTTSLLLLGIRYAVSAGADVINLSVASQGGSRSVQAAVDLAVRKNTVVVAISGNEGTKLDEKHDLASLDEVIVVGAAGKNAGGLYVWEKSNYGEKLDVLAPGVEIECASISESGYELCSGTSMACPHVAAQAAMLRLAYPAYSPAQIEALICQSAKDLLGEGRDPYSGWGFASLEAFIRADGEEIRILEERARSAPDYPLIGTAYVRIRLQKRMTSFDAQTDQEFFVPLFLPIGVETTIRQEDYDRYAEDCSRNAYESPVLTGTLLEDGLVLFELYYVRNLQITFDPGEHGLFSPLVTMTAPGSHIDPPAETPGETGYILDGWSPALSDWIFEDTVFVAQWRRETGTVRFETGSLAPAIKPLTVPLGECVKEPKAPRAEGFLFGGWYSDAACTKRADFTSPVTDDLTFYASWKKAGECRLRTLYKSADTPALTVQGLTGVLSEEEKAGIAAGSASAELLLEAGRVSADQSQEASLLLESLPAGFRDALCLDLALTKTLFLQDGKVQTEPVTGGEKSLFTVQIPLQTEGEITVLRYAEGKILTFDSLEAGQGEGRDASFLRSEKGLTLYSSCLGCFAIAGTGGGEGKGDEADIAPRIVMKKVKRKSSSLRLSWKAVPGAQYYRITCAPLKKKLLKKYAVHTKKTSIVLTKANGKKIHAQNLKYIVEAVGMAGEREIVLAKSPVFYLSAPESDVYTDPAGIRLKKKTMTLKAGKKKQIKADLLLEETGKRLLPCAKALRYESDCEAVAKVGAGGWIRAKAAGSCHIRIYALNGLSAEILLKVKG